MEEDEETIKDWEGEGEEEIDERCIIYQKGYPLYHLKKKEFCPQMNLLKTFSTKRPHITDFYKHWEKNKWTEQCTDAFILVLTDVMLFAGQKNLNPCQTAALCEIFYICFQYFFMLPALEKDQFLQYFRETLLQYSVFDPPERLRVFNGIEGFAIAKLFHELVANNFEMMKYVLVPVYRIEIEIQ